MTLSTTQVSQLYVILFGRASEGSGNTYWQTNQADMISTANAMLDTDAANTYFGSTLADNQKFIEHIYLNALDKTYSQDKAGIDYWVAKLESGESQGEVVTALINATQDSLNAGTAQDLFNNKVEVSDYTASKIAEFTDFATFTGYLDGVTNDSSSVVTSKAAIDSAADGTPTHTFPGSVASFTVLNNAGAWTPSTEYGNVTVTVDGANYVFTPTTGAAVNVPTVDVTSLVVNTITLTGTAAHLNGETITGTGTVAVTALDATPSANLSTITSTTVTAAVANDVVFTGNFGGSVVTLANDADLKTTAPKATGVTIKGVNGGATENVIITGLDGAAAYNLSTITTDLTSKIAQVGATSTLNAGTNIGSFAVHIAAGQALTLAASQANGATFAGTAADTTTATNGSIVVTGSAGDQTITGTANGDTITGGAGADTITGGAGNDTIVGAADSNDTYNVDAGTDGISVFGGSDVLNVSAGATANVAVSSDYIATAGTKSVGTGTANLTLANDIDANLSSATVATTSTDGFVVTAAGNAAASTILGSGGDDTLTGGNGADTITGGNGADTITGGAGGDTITGGGGNDTIIGAADSNDIYNVDSGVDGISVFGGADVLNVSAGATANVAVSSNYVATGSTKSVGTGTATLTLANDIDANLSSATVTTASTDGFIITASGNAAVSTIVGSGGADTITGGNGGDEIDAGAGDDTIIVTGTAAHAAGETINGGANTDTVRVTGDLVYSTTDSDLVGVENIVLVGTTVDITLTGQSDTLAITGAADTNAVVVGTGTTTYTGGLTATDIVSASAGAASTVVTGDATTITFTGNSQVDNFTNTGNGAVTFTGAGGNDVYVGGTAVDTIVFSDTAANNGVDAITGFTTTSDKLNLNALTADLSLTGATGGPMVADDVYLLTTAGNAENAANLRTAIDLAFGGGGTTHGAVTANIVIKDGDSSAVYEWTGDGAANGATGDTLTLMGTIDAVLVSGDILFA